MNRKILIITINYIIGLIWGLYFSKNIALIFCGIFILYFILAKKFVYVTLVSIIGVSCIYASTVKLNYSTKYTNNMHYNIVGTIIEIPEENAYSRKYILKVSSVNGDNSYKNTKVMVNEKGIKNIANYGSLVCISGEFKLADGKRNFGGYDYNEYLKSKKIYGIINTNSNEVAVYKLNNVSIYSKTVHKINVSIKNNIHKFLPEDTAMLCTAIILGDKTGLDQNTKEIFSESSLSHILAVSGMHMNYLVLMVSIFFRVCGKKWQKYFSVVIVVFFCNLVGNTNSVIRASIMIGIYFIAGILHRKSDSITNLSISALVILIDNPYAVKSVSFVLSFTATLSIILYKKLLDNKFESILNKSKVSKYIKSSIILSCSANILMLPVLAVYFNKVSFLFIISNFFASVLLSVIIPLAIICIVMSFIVINIATFFGYFLNFFLKIFVYISEIFSKIKMLNFLMATPSTFTIATYYFVVLLFLLKSNISNKKIINTLLKQILSVYILVCLVCNLFSFFDKKMYIHFIDVNQGDSTLIITPSNKKILIDGGGSDSNDYIGKNVLLPYLLSRKVTSLDYIMISHFDSDHVRWTFVCNEKN